MIRIVIIDDHPLISAGIKTMLADSEGFEVVATCGSASSALHYFSDPAHQAEIILLDISLPDMDGLQLCEHLRSNEVNSKIIGLTSANEYGIIAGLLQRGANGYLLKNMDRTELIKAIDSVLDGKIYLSKESNEQLLRHFKSAQSATSEIPVVTRREKELIQLLSAGLNGPQIAEKLFLSPYTVETHRKNLFRKFNVNSVQMLLKVARDYHLIDS